MSMMNSNLEFPLIARGKVRDVYETPLGILLVATDRLSAFDVVFPTPIPGKGRVLNQLSAWWFGQIANIVPHHLIDADPHEALGMDGSYPELRGRTMLCVTTAPLPVECVVRGFLEGSGWKDYQETGRVSGVQLPPGLQKGSALPEPIFTPSTKAADGSHDEAISFAQVEALVGADTAAQIRNYALALYRFAAERLRPLGIVVCDTKFEFGRLPSGEVILIDEALTPDSSRFFEAEEYLKTGQGRSLDKQFVRDYVETLDWNKQAPAPELPDEVVEQTAARYREIFERITGQALKED